MDMSNKEICRRAIGYRRAATTAGLIEFAIAVWSVFVLIFWVSNSRGGFKGTGTERRENVSCYDYDARNISTLSWEQNRTKIGIGKFLQVVICYKENPGRTEFIVHFIIDLLFNIFLGLLGLLVALIAGHSQSFELAVIKGLDCKTQTGPNIILIYLICNILYTVTDAIWKVADGMWIAFGVGVCIRTLLIVTVVVFLKQVLMLSKQIVP